MLLPLLSVAVAAAVAVALVSYWLGNRWAVQQTQVRFAEISDTLADAPFPLNEPIVDLLASLTGTELVTLTEQGQVIQSSIPIDRDRFKGPFSFEDQIRDPAAESASRQEPWGGASVRLVEVDGRRFRWATFRRVHVTSEVQEAHVAVLFDEAILRSARLRAAVLPLATGLSMIFLLASVTLWLTGRLVRRVRELQQDVGQIAEGDFDASIAVGDQDEIGRLGSAVDHMRSQLQQMWTTIHQQESEKLLHQVAGGLAHQLRNSITGARMAVELHAERCNENSDNALSVAVSQLETTDDYVRRLLLVASGKQDEDRPGSARQCLNDLYSGLATNAKHLGVDLDWKVDDSIADQHVADISSLASAVSNLVINAMQVAEHVSLEAHVVGDDRLVVKVCDDGPGPAAAIAGNLFEPFVTTKPEGLGLGLPVVRRSAERLGGTVDWKREGECTVFVMTLTCKNVPKKPSAQESAR